MQASKKILIMNFKVNITLLIFIVLSFVEIQAKKNEDDQNLVGHEQVVDAIEADAILKVLNENLKMLSMEDDENVINLKR